MTVWDAKFYQVGGAVRDRLLGVTPHDIDYTVEAESYEAMKVAVKFYGYDIVQENKEYFTLKGVRDGKPYDFVLARKEGAYTDGRRPDSVEMGTIFDDLARRDFTVNAMAQATDGTILDPYNGRRDLVWRNLVCVGDTRQKFTEDALRALRAIRFHITKQFYLSDEIDTALHSTWLPPLVEKIAVDRRREEMEKCLAYDTVSTLMILARAELLADAIFSGRLWLQPTTKESKYV